MKNTWIDDCYNNFKKLNKKKFDILIVRKQKVAQMNNPHIVTHERHKKRFRLQDLISNLK
jgi:hypothetical protein